MIKFRDFEKKEARKQPSQQEKQGFKTEDTSSRLNNIFLKLGDSDLLKSKVGK